MNPVAPDCIRGAIGLNRLEPREPGARKLWVALARAGAFRGGFMRLRRLTVQNLRNIPFAEFRFEGRQQFFVGPNGQGKTNLLEAIGFVTALRSFRTADTGLLIAQGKREGALAAEIDHEKFGPSRVVITLRPGGKEVTCDGERVARIGDFLGRFPTVVFSSQDQQLVRGAPALRRRWLDLALAGVDSNYLRALTSYHRALDGRNQLLKRQAPAAELAAFEAPLADAAHALVAGRRAGLAALAPHVAEAYARLSAHGETATLSYAADADPNALAAGRGRRTGAEAGSAGTQEAQEQGEQRLSRSGEQRAAGEHHASGAQAVAEVQGAAALAARGAAAWREHFAQGRARDLVMRSSLSGPHRDDLALQVGGRDARDFGSEGQQRSLVLALRLAQVSYIRARSGVEPVLLADDVLGELDPDRRRRFWAALGDERQVLATGTELPAAELGAWEVFRVAAGNFSPWAEDPILDRGGEHGTRGTRAARGPNGVQAP